MADSRGKGRGGSKGNRGSWRGGGGSGGGGRFGASNGGGGGGQIPKGDAISVLQADITWMNFLSIKDHKDTTTLVKVNAAKKFICSQNVRLNVNKGYFMLNCKSLLQNTELKQSWPDLKEELESKANKVMGIFGLAATGEEKVVMRPRLTGLKCAGSLRDLRSHDVGKLLSFQCSVIRQGHISQLCTWLAFQCEKCDAFCVVEQKPKGRYVRPNKCPSEGCRSQTFTPQRSHPATKTINSQMLRVQESEGRLQGGNGGRLPRAMDLHFSNDLCDSVSVGDVISLTAIVKVSSDPSDHMFNLYLEGLSVANSSSSQADNDKTQIEFTLLDYSMIQEVFSLGPEIFKLIVASLCPSIFGHELVKAGLVLALFGGTSKYANDRTHVPIRGDPHVLVVGDPGLGKSQILLSVQNCAPKSVFVTATGATTTGLTVTIVKGPGNGMSFESSLLTSTLKKS